MFAVKKNRYQQVVLLCCIDSPLIVIQPLPLPLSDPDKPFTAALKSLGHISLRTLGGANSSSLRTIDTTCSIGRRCNQERFRSFSVGGWSADGGLSSRDSPDVGFAVAVNAKLLLRVAAAAVRVGSSAAIYALKFSKEME